MYTGVDDRVVRDPELRHRIRRFAIPPAWTSVWICPIEHGHPPASGRDARGRKQYRCSFELTTLRSTHVEVDGAMLRVEFRGKGGKRLARVVKQCRVPGQELFQYVDAHGGRQTIDSAGHRPPGKSQADGKREVVRAITAVAPA